MVEVAGMTQTEEGHLLNKLCDERGQGGQGEGSVQNAREDSAMDRRVYVLGGFALSDVGGLPGARE